MTWRIAKSLGVLRDEVNERWSDRNKASDGVIGDAAHAASSSDHNPNAAGVVCAFDITHDPAGCDGDYLAELLRTNRHPDVKYVIWSGRMFSSYARSGAQPFDWRPYGGADPHTNHVHVSVGFGTDGQSAEPYDDTDSWGVMPPLTHPVPLNELPTEEEPMNTVVLDDGTIVNIVIGTNGQTYCSVKKPGEDWGKYASMPTCIVRDNVTANKPI